MKKQGKKAKKINGFIWMPFDLNTVDHSFFPIISSLASGFMNTDIVPIKWLSAFSLHKLYCRFGESL